MSVTPRPAGEEGEPHARRLLAPGALPGSSSDRGRPGLRELLALRLLLARRTLRTRRGTAEGIAQLLLVAMAVPAGLAMAGLVGVSSHRAARAGTGLAASLAAGATFFGLWQAWTAVGLTVHERDALALRRLLVYPLPPGRLYAMGLVAALVADPFSIFWLVVLAGVPAGAALARPGAWALLLGLVVIAFGAATVSLVALLQELVGRLGRGRLGRELAVGGAVVGWVALVAAGSSGGLAAHGALRALARIRWLLYPPALATEAARALYAGRSLAALPWIAALFAAALATGWLAFQQGLATARSGGEAALRRAGPRADEVGASARSPLARLGPLLEKELRYLARHPAARVYLLVLPALAAVGAWKVPIPREGALAELYAALPLLAIAAYAHLVLQTFWSNALGLERGGARAIFLAPVRPERVLLAKNAALLAWTLMLFAATASAWVAVAGPPPGWSSAGALLLVVGLAPLLYGCGNVASAVLPWAAPFGFQRAGTSSALSALTATAITSGALGAFALPVLAAVTLDALWVIPWAWAALSFAALAGWWLTLPAAGRMLVRRREEVMRAVCSDER